MPTIEDLGKQVKIRYPGVYDDLDDIELGQKTKTKFPDAYSDFSDTEAPEEQQGFLTRLQERTQERFEADKARVSATESGEQTGLESFFNQQDREQDFWEILLAKQQ